MRSEFIVERQGKTFCLFAGLLDEAHQQGLKEIRTTLLQIPTDENGHVAICQSEVTTERGVFTGLGDASPQNVSRAMLTCLIRMAETRAKARALRDAVNVGVVALEELDSNEENSDHADAGPAGSGRGSRAGAGSGPGSISTQGVAVKRGAPAVRSAVSSVGQEPEVRRAPLFKEGSSAAAAPPAAGTSASGTHAGSKPAGPGSTPADAMTPAQRRMLEALAAQAGQSPDLDHLSRQEASQMISELKLRLTQPKAA